MTIVLHPPPLSLPSQKDYIDIGRVESAVLEILSQLRVLWDVRGIEKHYLLHPSGMQATSTPIWDN